MSELLPCPFCGGEAVLLFTEETGFWDVQCQECGAMPFLSKQDEQVITEWNTRSAGTCGNKHKSITSFWCSECDAATSDGFADVSGKVERFNFCPNCGRKVSA